MGECEESESLHVEDLERLLVQIPFDVPDISRQGLDQGIEERVQVGVAVLRGHFALVHPTGVIPDYAVHTNLGDMSGDVAEELCDGVAPGIELCEESVPQPTLYPMSQGTVEHVAEHGND